MTIYTMENVLPCTRVTNTTSGDAINGVVRINTEQCTVDAFVYPLRVVDGEVATCTMRFRRIDVVMHAKWALAAQFNCHE